MVVLMRSIPSLKENVIAWNQTHGRVPTQISNSFCYHYIESIPESQQLITLHRDNHTFNTIIQ